MNGQIIEISALNAPEIAPYAHLTERQLRSGENLFIGESKNVILRALDAGCKPLSFLMERGQIEGAGREIIARCPDVPVYTAEREVLKQLIGYALTRGMLCALQRPAPRSVEAVLEDAKRLAVLENIADPSNLGAIFRSAAALGADGLLLSPGCCDPYYRKALRAGMGTIFQIPWAVMAADWPHGGMKTLRDAGFQTAALALDHRALPLNDARPARAEKLAILLGAEGTGLMPATIELADYVLKIPMARNIDSLNVSAATAIALWQLIER